ncbi:hypothetical protein [Streptomyces sp. NPDC089919]|uniref:hypothetical protein n=1 Tax=Streptomyces sp. NPDC089919 TaxID=3155188 RepID=UPI0034160415
MGDQPMAVTANRALSAIRTAAVLAAAGVAFGLASAQGALGGDAATHLRLDVGWNGPKPVVHAAAGTVRDVTGDIGWNAAQGEGDDVGWNGTTPDPGTTTPPAGSTDDVGWNSTTPGTGTPTPGTGDDVGWN